MFSKLDPRNDEWNRKYQFVDDGSYGFLMDIRNGIAFFAWVFPKTGIRHYKCEEPVFHNHFEVLQEQVEFEFDPYENIRFLRYPVET